MNVVDYHQLHRFCSPSPVEWWLVALGRWNFFWKENNHPSFAETEVYSRLPCVFVGRVFLVTLLLLAQHGTKLSVCILCLPPDTQYLKSTTIQIPHSGSFENWSVLHTCVDVTAVGSANPKSTQLSLFAPMHTRMEVMEGRNLRRPCPGHFLALARTERNCSQWGNSSRYLRSCSLTTVVRLRCQMFLESEHIFLFLFLAHPLVDLALPYLCINEQVPLLSRRPE